MRLVEVVVSGLPARIEQDVANRLAFLQAVGVGQSSCMTGSDPLINEADKNTFAADGKHDRRDCQYAHTERYSNAEQPQTPLE